MNSSRTITLFSERPDVGQGSSSFIVSILAHLAAVGLLFLGIAYAPRVNDQAAAKRYTLRHLDLNTPELKTGQSPGAGIAYPGPQLDAQKSPDGQLQSPIQAALRQTANADKGPQTLIQPDILDPVKMTQVTPVPTVIIWSPRKVVVKTIVAPLPQKATASEVKPSIQAPNQELNLADIALSSTDSPTSTISVPPSTTSPLVVHGPTVSQMAPVTATQKSAQPTPTAVMSISDTRMLQGSAMLPPANQTTEQNTSGVLAAGQPSGGHPTAQPGTMPRDTGSGKAQQANGGAGTRIGTGMASAGPPANGSGNAQGVGLGVGAGTDEGLSTTHIALPRDGQFGSVLVGVNLEEKFPELADVWNDRIAYTVYLHVGLAKSWILQYSMPHSSDAAQAGSVLRIDAPWPYNIVRPNLPPGFFNSDAILVHGFVNQAGRFESLVLAFPPNFQQAKFILDALNQWQFRPAAQNGKPEKVEVLLIIPEEEEQSLVQEPPQPNSILGNGTTIGPAAQVDPLPSHH